MAAHKKYPDELREGKGLGEIARVAGDRRRLAAP
jgi:hypothetical protein